jgi:methyltransferase (TIGR00027 family)
MRAGQASTTAQRVARHRLGFQRPPGPSGGAPDADRRLQADVAGDLGDGGAGVESPMTRYFQARTAFFDRVVVDAITAGRPQVVAVGAGYDGRSLRYAGPGVAWFELDHPDTQTDKRARLARLGIDTGGLAFAPADFAVDDVASALASVGHDPRRPSLFTCEGVAAYLTTPVLSRLLSALASVAAPDSTLAIEIAVEPVSAAERNRRARLNAAVAGLGEPLSASLPREDLTGLLAAAGWRRRSATDPAGVDIDASPRSTAFVIATPATAEAG